MLRAHHDAEEVVQEALARAWRSHQSCRTPEAPLPWCLQITRNEALRRIDRGREHGHGEPLELIAADLPDQRTLNDRDRMLARIDIDRALLELTPSDRLLITLRYEHDYSHPEIAQKLEIPEATARVRLHRVHKRLRSLLEDRI